MRIKSLEVDLWVIMMSVEIQLIIIMLRYVTTVFAKELSIMQKILKTKILCTIASQFLKLSLLMFKNNMISSAEMEGVLTVKKKENKK